MPRAMLACTMSDQTSTSTRVFVRLPPIVAATVQAAVPGSPATSISWPEIAAWAAASRR
jgi:hypothetical protein